MSIDEIELRIVCPMLDWTGLHIVDGVGLRLDTSTVLQRMLSRAFTSGSSSVVRICAGLGSVSTGARLSSAV